MGIPVSQPSPLIKVKLWKYKNVVARIQPGEAFTSAPTIIQIPSGAPDELTVRLLIDDVYYHHAREDQVKMDGLSGEFSVLLVDTSYFGEISTITPTVSTGDQDIIITGRAVDRDSSTALADASLKLVITINGFERSVTVVTDTEGIFTYAFAPNTGESGRYQVRAMHPDLLDKPVHGEFVITRVAVIPTTINLSIPRNYEQNFSVKVKTGNGTELNNLQLLYREEDQNGGAYPEGVHLTPGPVQVKMLENTTTSLPHYLSNSGPITALRIVTR